MPGCVPIYWGDRSVFEIFNADAFIYAGDNPNDLAAMRAAVEKAIEVARDPQVAQRYLSAPRLVPGAWGRFLRWEPTNPSMSVPTDLSDDRSLLERIRAKVLDLASAPEEAFVASVPESNDADEQQDAETAASFTQTVEDWAADHTAESLVTVGTDLLKSG